MQKAFVRFKAANWTEGTPVYRPEIFSLFSTGAVRATLPAEWHNRETDPTMALPEWTEEADQLSRYQSYDNALRDPDVDTDD